MDPLSPQDTVDFVAPQWKSRHRPEPYSSLFKLDVHGVSHPGRVRPNNEDHFFICRFGRFLETLASNLPAGAVPSRAEEVGFGMAVADGLGGGAAGEEASRRAIASLVNLVLHMPDWVLRLDDEALTQENMRRIAGLFHLVNKRLAEDALEIPGLSGFGTTMTVAYSIAEELFIAHLGDSRAYLFSEGRLQRLTHDHTLVQVLVDQQLIDPTEAATHGQRHVLTQALGDFGKEIQPEISQTTLKDGDCVLLCTDGLTELVDDETIGEILGGGEAASATSQRLLDQALDSGGHDNVTVVVARYHFPNAS